MRFSAAIQAPVPGVPAPAARPEPAGGERLTQPQPPLPQPPCDVPPDLDQRVRLTGEW